MRSEPQMTPSLSWQDGVEQLTCSLYRVSAYALLNWTDDVAILASCSVGSTACMQRPVWQCKLGRQPAQGEAEHQKSHVDRTFMGHKTHQITRQSAHQLLCQTRNSGR